MSTPPICPPCGRTACTCPNRSRVLGLPSDNFGKCPECPDYTPPRAGSPEWADALITNTDITFGWGDRFRILLRGSVNVWTRTRTEHLPGKTLTDACRVTVPSIFPRPSEHGAEVVAPGGGAVATTPDEPDAVE